MANILVIEDEARIRENLVRFLKLEGHTPVAAIDGLAGLQAAQANPPALIFCDVMMPRMDGFEVLAALKQDPRLRDIPFYFVSASAEPERLEASHALGANGYVTKPFNLPQLLALLRLHLESS